MAVTGASGTVGRSLLRRLEREDEVGSIVAIGRTPPADGPSRPKLHFRRADLRDVAALRGAISGSDVVVHLGFALHGRPDEDALFQVNVEGTRHVAEAAVADGAERLVYASSIVVYGFHRRNTEPLNEDAPIQASTRHFYGRHKAQAELLVEQATAGESIDAYVFRPGLIVGPEPLAGTLNRFPEALVAAGQRSLKGLMGAGVRPPVLGLPVPIQAVHQDDVADALVLAVLGRGPAGIYNLVGDGVVEGNDVPGLFGLPRAPVPSVLTRLGARATARGASALPLLGWAEPATAPLIVDASKAREKLGWRPNYSSRAALRSMRALLGT